MSIRRLRESRGLTLRQLALQAGLSPAHLSRIERGVGAASAALVGRIADALGVDARSLGAPRPRLKLESKYDLARQFGYVAATQPTGTLRVAYREALYREPGPGLLRALDAQIRPAAFWHAAKLLPRECNGPEQTLILHLLSPRAHLQEIHPHKLGLACPVVQAPSRRWLAIVLEDAGTLVAVMPQVKIETRAGRHPQLDFLVAVRSSGSKRLLDVELDGPFHKAREDRLRDQEVGKLGIQPLRYPVDDVYHPDFATILLRRVTAMAA